MSWFLLVLAGLFEIGWAIGLKYTEGFTRFWPSIFTVASMAVSVLLLGLAVKQLPIGTAYGVWVGIGAMGTAIAGIILLGEGVSLLKIASLILILLGVLGLKLAH
ncbi:quaternary ammonium compound efflux SMR transporter SugE [Shewanella sp. NKUCC06_TVS]|uniref:quaternary ammonium compound efflux SMR transporter SugE n=1 Tax=Shewanella sp. NKUCC06_TVS TaxID=2842128 RepID=UPI001C5AA45C|nr:quaternary ammonium compound efflux SMR transporter SugE [Shewanella sp. NKUCC06_TVS]MBW3530898.1 quaternary ammonium compound efflux SMR transporter SugE [Shewanella sp. NKUCC06_TVS]